MADVRPSSSIGCCSQKTAIFFNLYLPDSCTMFLNNKQTKEEKKEYNYSSEPQEPVLTLSRGTSLCSTHLV